MSLPAAPWWVQHLCSLSSCKVILLHLSLSGVGMSLVRLFFCYKVSAWPGVCNPTVTQPQRYLAPVRHLLQGSFSRPGAAVVGWDVPLG